MAETKFPSEGELENESGEEANKIFDDLDIGEARQNSGTSNADDQADGFVKKNQDKTHSIGENPMDEQSETVEISKTKILLLKKLLENIKESQDKMENLLAAFISPGEESKINVSQIGEYMSASNGSANQESGSEGRVIEGVFDGENMIGPDGKQYSVPANYASKSKLVEGDILKLTITPNGTFLYKQIGPIERRRVVGTLEQTPSGNFIVNSDGKKWQVLIASVTYFKGEPGDEAVILIPKRGESRWAAVENVVRKHS